MATVHSNGNGRGTRAVLYLRMSSAQQETSIPNQRFELVRYAKTHGYEIVREYLDEAISGDKTDKRLGFLQMRDDCSTGEFDLVLCWDQDRFGRFDLIAAGHWITPFRDAGVRLETIAQGTIDWEDLIGQLIYSVNQMGKNQFLKDLSHNTTRGILLSAREGTSGSGGKSPFGYRPEYKYNADGKRKVIGVAIVEAEAETVRLLFRLYLKADGSLLDVTRQLNQRRIPTPSQTRKSNKVTKCVWRNSTVRSILKNEKYTGCFVLGRQNSGSYFGIQDGEVIPRHKSDGNTKAKPIRHQGKFAAIVSQDVFDRAQRKLSGNKTKNSTRSARRYALAGLLKCGDCDGAMGGNTKKGNAIYHCRQYHSTGTTSCYCNTIQEARLISVIVDKIQTKYLSPAALDRLRRALTTEQQRTKPKAQDVNRLKAEIATLDAKVNNAEDSVLEAPASLRPGLYRKLESLTNDRDRLVTELDALTRTETRSNGRDGSEIDQTIRALRGLSKAFSKAKPEDIRELLESIVSKVELRFDHEQSKGGRTRSTFRDGTIYVRPDADNSAHHTNPRCFITASNTRRNLGSSRAV